MTEDSSKGLGLLLLRAAMVLYPALESLIRAAIEAFTARPGEFDDDAMHVADEVKAILPVRSASEQALRDILASGKGI